MLILVTLMPVVLIVAWIATEYRGKTMSRLLLGTAALMSLAIAAFMWGSCAEAFSSVRFPVPHDAQDNDDPFDVAVEVGYAGGASRSIAISITNNGDEAIEILECNLPWQHWHSIELFLVKSDDAMSAIEAGVPPIDDPVAATVRIAPGEVVRGEIALHRMYPTLDAVLASSRVDVFYAFDVRPIGNPSPRRFGGWFNIPRNGRGNPDGEKVPTDSH
jgi:hypothetical protein